MGFAETGFIPMAKQEKLDVVDIHASLDLPDVLLAESSSAAEVGIFYVWYSVTGIAVYEKYYVTRLNLIGVKIL